MATRYKPLDDATRARCITVLENAVVMVQQYERVLEMAGMAVHGALEALKATEEVDEQNNH